MTTFTVEAESGTRYTVERRPLPIPRGPEWRVYLEDSTGEDEQNACAHTRDEALDRIEEWEDAA